jgi:hypothetical protein
MTNVMITHACSELRNLGIRMGRAMHHKSFSSEKVRATSESSEALFYALIEIELEAKSRLNSLRNAAFEYLLKATCVSSK